MSESKGKVKVNTGMLPIEFNFGGREYILKATSNNKLILNKKEKQEKENKKNH